MTKNEVYSWRVASDTKMALENEARREGTTVAAVLDRLVRERLAERRRAAVEDEAEQKRLHAAAVATFGTIRGGGGQSATNERVHAVIRKHLEQRYGRRRAR